MSAVDIISPFTGELIRFDVLSLNPQPSVCKEETMSIKATEMYHLVKSKESQIFDNRIATVLRDIRDAADNGNYYLRTGFAEGSSVFNKMKDHLVKFGFEVTDIKDEDGDPQLLISWENAKEAA